MSEYIEQQIYVSTVDLFDAHNIIIGEERNKRGREGEMRVPFFRQILETRYVRPDKISLLSLTITINV